jgi:hypothetical protein
MVYRLRILIIGMGEGGEVLKVIVDNDKCQANGRSHTREGR